MLDVTAMAIAAKALGFPGAAWLIEREQLTACQVKRMFLSGAAADRGKIAAVIVLAGATARHHFKPDGWNGETEKALAVAALDLTSDRCLFDHAAETARRIIQANLNAVAFRVKSASRNDRRRRGMAFESLVSDFDGRRGARH